MAMSFLRGCMRLFIWFVRCVEALRMSPVSQNIGSPFAFVEILTLRAASQAAHPLLAKENPRFRSFVLFFGVKPVHPGENTAFRVIKNRILVFIHCTTQRWCFWPLAALSLPPKKVSFTFALPRGLQVFYQGTCSGYLRRQVKMLYGGRGEAIVAMKTEAAVIVTYYIQ